MTFGRALALHITIGFDKICVLFEKQRSIAVSWHRSPEPCLVLPFASTPNTAACKRRISLL